MARPHPRRWLPLLYGQAIALVVSSMNAASYTLSFYCRVNTQIFQLLLVYLILSANLLFRKHPANDGRDFIPFTQVRLQMPWWKYFLLSLLDVIPNFIQLISFQYTSLTSTTLLSSVTTPSTMLVSHYVLARTFGKWQYIGVILCLVGSAMTIWSDLDDDTSHAHSWIGDVLAVTAAVLNGSADVFSEYCIKNVDKFELLGMLGIYGTILTVLSCPWLEGEILMDVVQHRTSQEQMDIGLVIGWYVVSVLLYYMGEAFFLVSSEATLLNLSLQTSNLWAVIFSFLLFHILPAGLFYIALALVVGGVCIYEATSTLKEESPCEEKSELTSLQSSSSYDGYSSTTLSDNPVV